MTKDALYFYLLQSWKWFSLFHQSGKFFRTGATSRRRRYAPPFAAWSSPREITSKRKKRNLSSCNQKNVWQSQFWIIIIKQKEKFAFVDRGKQQTINNLIKISQFYCDQNLIWIPFSEAHQGITNKRSPKRKSDFT